MKKRTTLMTILSIWAICFTNSVSHAQSGKTLISSSATWCYYAKGQEPLKQVGTKWNQLVFNTSSLASGPAKLGYGGTNWQSIATQKLSGTKKKITFNSSLENTKNYIWNCEVFNTAGHSDRAKSNYHLTVDTHSPNEPKATAPSDLSLIQIEQKKLALRVTVTDPDEDAMDVMFYGRKTPSSADNFTIVVLPDTQKYSQKYPDIFTAQTRWIVNHKDELNIVFVIHEGDIVENWNSETEWQRAVSSMRLLEGVVPYAVLPGNHDNKHGADSTYYNQHFPYTRYQKRTWFGGHYPPGKNDNNFQIISIGDVDLILFHFAYTPSSDVLEWASHILTDRYPGRKAIITTHGLLSPDGSFDISPGGNMRYVWDSMVANDNVFFALCGHEWPGGEYHTSVEINGRLVHQVLADYQDRPNGGNGWLRVMQFKPLENAVHVKTYSPVLDLFETDSDSEFTLYFPMVDFKEIGRINNVSSGSAVSQMSPNPRHQNQKMPNKGILK